MKFLRLMAIGIFLILLAAPSREQTTILIPGVNCSDNFDKVYSGTWWPLPSSITLRSSANSIGNAMFTRKDYDLKDSEIYFKWRLEDNSFHSYVYIGVAAVIYPGVFAEGYDTPPAGMIPINTVTWYYTRISIHPDRSWSASTCTGDYDNNGGIHLFDTTGLVNPILWKYVATAKLEAAFEFSGTVQGLRVMEMKIVNGPEANFPALSCTSVYTFEDGVKPPEFTYQGSWNIIKFAYTSKMVYSTGFNTISLSISKRNVVKVGFDVVVDNSSGSIPWDKMHFLINDTLFRTCTPDWDKRADHFEMRLPPGGMRTFKWEITPDNFYGVILAVDNISFTYADSAKVTAIPSVNPVCQGSPVAFTSQVTYGGSPAQYQWYLNGSAMLGATGPGWPAGILSDNDQVWVAEHHHDQCPDTVLSDTVVIHTKPLPWTDISFCADNLYRDSRKLTLRGGLPVGGTWSGPGVSGTIFDPSLVPLGIENPRIIYTYTGSNGCTDTTGKTLNLYPTTSFTCGTPFTDPRDNIQYPTFFAGSRCWFAKNLEHGINISSSINQQDNCIDEKYVALAMGALPSGLYQWDEVVNYEGNSGFQDICPPGWHLPSVSEWDLLMNDFGGAAHAGNELAQGGSSGFSGLFYGDRFMNSYTENSGDFTLFWTSDRSGVSKAYAHGIDKRCDGVTTYLSGTNNAFAVRCVHN